MEELYDVSEPTTVIYGQNATILPVIFQQSDEAVPRPLPMDIYTPVGDNNDERPVMLVFHTGNFLPFPQNNGTGGTRQDSTVVETCKRLAKRGYVACAVDYRLGWNPVDPDQDFRTFFLINAAYRGVQDARTAVRYMRLNAVDGGDSFGIDPDKIGVWGIGTGGYIAAAVATLDKYEEIPALTKFLITLNGMTVPMVNEEWNGNIYGTSVGILPFPLPPLPAGDTLCYPNHVTYADGSEISSDVSFIVNNGGALGDISWLDENVPPWVSFHTPSDPFAPYTNAVLTVPGTGDPADPSDDFAVMAVDGSYNIQQKMTELGFNDIFDAILPEPNVVDYSEVADSRNDGYNGLFPTPNNSPVNNSAPWDFYADDIPTIPPQSISDPVLAKTYWDTIFAYVAPRACLALDLGCADITSINEIDAAVVNFQLAPNPAGETFRISTASDQPMISTQLFDVMGKVAQDITIINNTDHVISRNGLAPGLYYIKVNFKEGSLVEKVIFK